MESLKQFLGNGKTFIKRIVGLEEWTDPPAMLVTIDGDIEI